MKYKIDLPANRYDLVCLEGLGKALRYFRNTALPLPKYNVLGAGSEEWTMKVDPSVKSVRPFIVCGVLKNITFTADSYKHFIDLQDKLHFNVGRQRSLVSIGTHDLDTLAQPFLYTAKPPEEIEFVALNQTKKMNCRQLFEHIEANEAHLKPYLPLISSSPLYPVIYDSNGVVLSLPPIINGEHSKITLATKNVFIEVTARDRTKAHVALNTILTIFSQYCQNPWESHAVRVVEDEQTTVSTPIFPQLEVPVALEYINRNLGLALSSEEACTLLRRMMLDARPSADGQSITAVIPPSRTDIMHPCDIMEDVGIAYGFNNLPSTIPSTVSIGARQPRNKLTELLRFEIAAAGFSEILTFSLCAIKENFEQLRRSDNGSAVLLSNFKSETTAACRTTLLVGSLLTLQSNLSQPVPIKIFEISDVVLKDPTNAVGASNHLRLCAMYAGMEAGFEIVHGLLDRVMTLLAVPWCPKTGYFLRESADPVFIEGRRADIFATLKGRTEPVKLGSMGIVHPEVISNFKLKYPCSAIEIDLDLLV